MLETRPGCGDDRRCSQLKLCHDACTQSSLSWRETISIEGGTPLAAMEDAEHAVADTLKQPCNVEIAAGRTDTRRLVCLLQVDLVSQEHVRVQGLEESRHLRGHNDGPDPRCRTRCKNARVQMCLARVEQENHLELILEGRQGRREPMHDLGDKWGVHPRAPLPEDADVGGASRAQGGKLPNFDGAFVAYHNLRQQGLYGWVVTYKGHVRQVRAPLRDRHVLNRGVALPKKYVTSACALEETDGRFVEVNPKRTPTWWHLAEGVVSPLPRCKRLCSDAHDTDAPKTDCGIGWCMRMGELGSIKSGSV